MERRVTKTNNTTGRDVGPWGKATGTGPYETQNRNPRISKQTRRLVYVALADGRDNNVTPRALEKKGLVAGASGEVPINQSVSQSDSQAISPSVCQSDFTMTREPATSKRRTTYEQAQQQLTVCSVEALNCNIDNSYLVVLLSRAVPRSPGCASSTCDVEHRGHVVSAWPAVVEHPAGVQARVLRHIALAKHVLQLLSGLK
jgi:hypothetical protein